MSVAQQAPPRRPGARAGIGAATGPLALVAALALALMAAACAPASQPASPAGPEAKPAGGPTAGAGVGSAALPSPPPPAAEAPARVAVKLGYSVLSPANAALITAAEGGLYERNGLDVELVALGAGQTSQAAIISGEVPAASASPTTAYAAVLAGADLAIVGAVFDTIAFQIISSPELTTLADLRGKTVGVNRLEGAPHVALRYVVRRAAGLDLDHETRVIQVGGQPERVAALRSGAVQATLVDPPFAELAEREGLRVLADTAEMNVPYPLTALVMHGEFLRGQRDVARRVLQSVVDGSRAFRTDRALGVRTLRAWFKVDDEDLLAETYTYFSKLMPTDVLPRPEGLEVAWEELPAEQREGRSFQPQDIVDASLAREIR
ncbi:MAG TPA: ABC transporter substrate-binding protein [Chloroflexota bacterium]|nr:ABC transporter substrate-binding protein [Chloroflexota bacterium]